MSTPDNEPLKNPYRNELEALTKTPKWELTHNARSRKIPETILPMHTCIACNIGTNVAIFSLVATIVLFGIYGLQYLAPILIPAGLFFVVGVFVAHVKTHLRPCTAEMTGLGSSTMLPIEVIEHVDRWIVTHPITVGGVETPWRSVKAIKEHSKARLTASLVIPIECRTLANGFAPRIDRDLNLTVDATRASSGGTDVKVSVQFTAIDQNQSNQTVATVVGGIVTAVVTQELLQVAGNRTPVRWFLPEPVWSRDDVKFNARVKGALIMSTADDTNTERQVEYVLREIQTLIYIVANEFDSSILKSDTVALRSTAATRLSSLELPFDCRFELDDIQLEEVHSELPAPVGTRGIRASNKGLR